jgi:hypothetical protein
MRATIKPDVDALFDAIKSELPEPAPGAISRDVITVIVDLESPLGKTFEVTPDGSVDKRARVWTSWAAAMQFDCSTADDLAGVLRVVGTSPHAAVINACFPAVPPEQEFRIASQPKIRDLFGPTADTRGVHTLVEGEQQWTVVGRVKEQTAASSWQLLDRDVDEHTPPALAAADFDEWLALVDRLLPGVTDVTRVVVPSGSARVVREGQSVGGGNGHVWLQVADPSDVDRTRAALICRAIALGLAWTKPQRSRKTGEIVGRGWATVVDPSVWTVGRLVFDGAPTAGAGLTVAPPDVRVIKVGEGLPGWLVGDAPNRASARLDTSAAVIDEQATQVASEAAGQPLRIVGKGDRLEMLSEDLRLDTELELDGGELVTVEELMRRPLGGGKIRCQAPFRDSVSMAAFFAIGPVGGPFVFDSGTGIKHTLLKNVQEAAQAALTAAQLDRLRREAQKRENERIGEGPEPIPTAEVITLEDARARFVFLEDGSRVADRLKPHYDLSLADFRNAYSASKVAVPQPVRQNADGSTVQRPPKLAPVADLWVTSPQRLTVVTRTFKAGGAEFLQDPAGRAALNTWRPFDRRLVVDDPQAVTLFLEQVQYLFEDSAGRFLEWLAHIEQQPGVLPHTCWLHVATQFGLGRNWLGGLLARVWAGSVAANFDLSAALKSGFNDRLSRKVLAIVDEIDEGGGDSKWQHAETVKRMLTEDVREINPKFGRKSVEFNACRMLLFSNHTHALPTVEGDRRVEVKILRAPPRSAEAYAKLYNALNDPRFVAAVAGFLGAYDLSKFSPGRRALMDESKVEFQAASQSQPAHWAKTLRDHWPVDLITNNEMFRVLDGGGPTSVFGGEMRNLTPAHRRTLAEYGFRSRDKPIKVAGMAARVQIIRNHDRWLTAEPHECRAELERWKPTRADLRQELLELSAEEG